MIIGLGAPLEGHTRTVTALAVHDGLLYSSANDCTVRLWDGPQLLMTLAEGVDPYGSLSVLRDCIVESALARQPTRGHAPTHRSRGPSDRLGLPSRARKEHPFRLVTEVGLRWRRLTSFSRRSHRLLSLQARPNRLHCARWRPGRLALALQLAAGKGALVLFAGRPLRQAQQR